MLSRKVKSRIYVLMLSLITVATIIFLIFRSLEESVVFFFSPTEIYSKPNKSLNRTIRLGGLVKEGSIKKNKTTTNFIITDLKNEINISFNGQVPNLFSEGKGVVVEGKLKDKKYFIAENILAKHDENYMPPEVSKVLEKSN